MTLRWNEPNETSRQNSRHTRGRTVVGPVYDLVLNDILSVLVPTHPVSHGRKFVVVTMILLMGPWMLSSCWIHSWHWHYTQNNYDNNNNPNGLLCSSSSSSSSFSSTATQRELLPPCQAETRHLYLDEVEYMAWIALITILGLILWCNHQKRILWMLWHRPVWMDPTTPQEGPRLPTSTTNLRFYPSIHAARAGACTFPEAVAVGGAQDEDKAATPPATPTTTQSSSPHVWNLNGSWEFQLCATVQDGMSLAQQQQQQQHTNKNRSHWPTIRVPSNWMLQPNVPDIPIYTNQKYPIPCEPPLVPHKNPTGVYRHYLPDDIFYTLYKGDEYWLHIHGAESMVVVYLNGQRVGYAKDSRMASTWNITAFLRPRHNLLTLVVIRWCDGTYLEDQDHWHLAGLHRSVELVRRPAAARIADIFVQHATHHGYLQVKVTLDDDRDIFKKTRKTMATKSTEGNTTTTSRLKFAVYDDQPANPNGCDVICASMAMVGAIVETPNKDSVTWTTRVTQIKPWSAEDPHLYTLVVSLVGPDGSIVQAESCRIGFRTVSIVHGQVCWNDRPITICGMNRHEHDPDHGKVVSLARMRQDVVTLKRNNFNAVRTSHYPQHPTFYRLCDYYGLYVIDEANLETHGMRPMGRLVHDKEGWGETILPRIINMVQRDKNHACIMAWSLGNEAGRGRNLWQARQRVMDMDPSRLVVYESGGLIVEGTGRTELTDVVCTMYPDVPRAIRLATRSDEDRPVILCEYSHAMGNSNGNLHLYWKEFWDPKIPRLQGGFIWDMIDQGIRKVDDLTGREYFAYGGDFGETITDFQFCINGMFTPEREPHPAVAEIRYLMQPVVFSPNEPFTDSQCIRVEVEEGGLSCGVRFTVHNRYVFSTLEHLSWTWSVSSNRDVEPIHTSSFQLKDPAGKEEVVIDLNRCISEVVALEESRPARSNSYYLNLRGYLKKSTSWAEAGHVLVTQQFPVKFVFSNPVTRKSSRPCVLMKPLSWRVGDGKVYIECSVEDTVKKFVTIDVNSGAIESFYSSSGDNLLVDPLLPNFVRASTDNDKGGFEKPLEFLFPGINFNVMFGLLHNLDDFSYWARWKLVGLDPSIPLVVDCSDLYMCFNSDQTQVHARGLCQVRCPSHGTCLFNVQFNYRVFGDCRVRVDYHVEPTTIVKHVTSLARVGVRFSMAPSYYDISYFGRGPGENYPDRKSGSEIGQYRTTPHDMGYVKYIVPGENGSRSDCEWIALRQPETGVGLLITVDESKDESFSCSALHYSAAELDRASHTCYLSQRADGEDPVHVTIDHKLMGVGGDTSWYPVVYPEFQVKANLSYTFGFWMVPLSSKDDDVATLSRDAFPNFSIDKA